MQLRVVGSGAPAQFDLCMLGQKCQTEPGLQSALSLLPDRVVAKQKDEHDHTHQQRIMCCCVQHVLRSGQAQVYHL